MLLPFDILPCQMAVVRSSPFLIPLANTEGQKLLQECHYSRLLHYFCKQVNSKYCGLCSAAICLNEILENCPQNDFHHGKLAKLVLVKEMKTTLQEDDILMIGEESSLFRKVNVDVEGMTLQTFSGLMKIIGFQADFYHVFHPSQNINITDKNYPGISTVDEFRSIALENLRKPGGHVVVNYFLAVFYPDVNFGHFSPLGGYHVEEDRFLLLDVWPRNPIGWVKTEHLFNSMMHEDSSSHLPRGFCVFNVDSVLPET